MDLRNPAPRIGRAVWTVLLACTAMPALAAELRVLDAGATDPTLGAVAGTFQARSGWSVKLSHGPVGALRDRILSGEPADVAIVTPAVLEQLDARKALLPGSRVDLGRVGGGIAVRAGAPRPVIRSAEALRQALLDAEEIYYPNPEKATAGAWFLQVADRLGVGDQVRMKAHTAADGRAAMRLMLRSTARAIGFTQESEIRAVKGVVLVGPYPADLQQLTTYSGVVLARAAHPRQAREFLRFLRSRRVQDRFRAAGFTPAS